MTCWLWEASVDGPAMVCRYIMYSKERCFGITNNEGGSFLLDMPCQQFLASDRRYIKLRGKKKKVFFFLVNFAPTVAC
jgi:hypothetical protein